MTISPVPTKSIKFTDFDFEVDRNRFTTTEPHDGCVTIRLPGKSRKTANHELVFIPFFKKYRLKFKTVAIGKSRKKTKSPIVVFDQDTLSQESAPIRKYDHTSGFINSKAHALKILEIFNIAHPRKSGEVVKLYFKLHPTANSETQLNYKVCMISLMKVITDGTRKENSPPIKRKKRLKKLKDFKSPVTVNPENADSANII